MVLADDDVLLREGLASLLDRSGLQVVGQAGDADELIELVGKERPELAVVDIRMPPTYSTEGLAAARVIQREFPQTAVVVLSLTDRLLLAAMRVTAPWGRIVE